MSFSINYTPFFEKEFKKLYKKHRSLKDDLNKVINQLAENPQAGESVGNDCYKIRMSIYDKSDISTTAEEQILIRLQNIK